MRNVVVLALVGVALVAPMAQAQALVPSGVYLRGDDPETISVRLGERVNYTVEYEYLVGAGNFGETKIDLNIEEKPDWLKIDHPDTINVPVEPTERRTTEEVVFVFSINGSASAVAFRPAKVTLGVHAQENGYIAESRNTKSFFPRVEYRPGLDIQTPGQPMRIGAGEVRHADVTVTNRGNAPIVPSFDVVNDPDGVKARISSENRRLEPYQVDRDGSRTTANLVIEDRSGDWNTQPVSVQITYVPFRKPDGPVVVDTQQIWISRSTGGIGGIVVPLLPIVGIGGIGVAYYHLQRRGSSVWPENI